MNILKSVSHNLQNIPGKRTKRKLVIIESDDWGSIRMSSKESYMSLLKNKIPVDKSYYNRYDSLASENDLNNLFEILTSYKDSNGRHPVITANTIVGNPDFDKIKKENYQKYHFELFTETLKKYPNHSNSFSLWKKGIENRIFVPQLHGREHLNYKRWMKSLQINDISARLAFEHKIFGYPLTKANSPNQNFMASFDVDEQNDIVDQKKNVKEAVNLFRDIFDYKAETFIAPNYVWHKGIEEALGDSGVYQLQSGLYQFVPKIKSTTYRKKFHYLGENNEFNQIYTVRNCFFEPSFCNRSDWVGYCLNRINTAFRWQKPAIICSHRVNYIGNISRSNRENGLRQLDDLIKKILIRWPDALFISSNELKHYLN